MSYERRARPGNVIPPTLRQVAAYAKTLGLPISTDRLELVCRRVAESLEVFEHLDELGTAGVNSRHLERDAGRPPSEQEDPYNAIVRFCSVKGAESGPLAGWRVGVKDNIAVAGVPMTEGHPELTTLPAEDAVVVERILDAGASIVAKTAIDDDDRPCGNTRNPHNPEYSAGGSSGGSAAAVAAGMVDAAIGVDQGGSIRNPASWCGVVGMKPTHGLVPSYGLAYWDHTLDHIGPMTRTVAENAIMLEVLAGEDWRDPQWVRANPVKGDYVSAADRDVKDLRVGIVMEASEFAACTAATTDAFERARRVLERLGAHVSRCSIPLWTEAPTIWLATVTFGTMAMADSFGQGVGHKGRADVERASVLADQYRRGVRSSPWLSPTLPLTFMHLREVAPGRHAATAQNLRIELRSQVQVLFRNFDLLITPTMPKGPERIPTARTARAEPASFVEVASGLTNVAVDLTGHPALTVPSGPGDDGLPTGLQIIGRPFDENTVYRAGFAIEAAIFS
jgi:amidase